ncbi:MAG: hypothetical protein LBT10_05885 [Methanobrevibacter sp.]|jgi:hypothetical protein|nr:hypothetical protein [Methanobrevibacter sp.]
MKTLSAYIENSVIGGYFDEEFKESTVLLFDEFKKGNYKSVISDHVISELDDGAPQYIVDNLNTLIYEKVEVTDEMRNLADLYVEKGIITPKFYGDALHIAIATVIGVDVLISWNFRHIVNLNKIKQFNLVNLNENYRELEIRTPKEMINYE